MSRKKNGAPSRRHRMVSLDIGTDAYEALERLTQARQHDSPRRKVTKTEILRDLILDADSS